MISRRDVLFAGGVTALMPQWARAKQGGRVWRLGFLTPSLPYKPGEPNLYGIAFVQEMQAQGFTYGVDFTAESRSAEGDPARMPALAAELAKSVDILLPISGSAARAAQLASKTLPVVMIGAHDPVGMGLVPSLARPGGNLTGVATFYGDLMPKQIELLKAVAPKVTRLGLLSNEGVSNYAELLNRIRTVATANGLQMQLFSVNDETQIARAFEAMARERIGEFIAAADPLFIAHRREVAQLAIARRMASVFANREVVAAGGLVSYGESGTGMFAQAARYVARIFKGAKPGDLPIEQPTTFHLAFNRATARAIGVAAPQEILIRADEVFD